MGCYLPSSSSSSDPALAAARCCAAAMNAHPEYFSPNLYRALKRNTTKQETHDGLQGLDFDPFLNSQDPASKYVVGNVDGTDEGYEIEVYGVQNGRRQGQPDVVAVVRNQHNHWVLTNFHYPDSGEYPETASPR